MVTENWTAWIRPLDDGLMVVGVRRTDRADASWVVAADAPRDVAEYLELRGMLIDPRVCPTLGDLRQLAMPTALTDHADGMPGDVVLTFEVAAYDPPERLDTVTVDLKWSLWSADRGHWDEYAPGTWERMAAAYAGTDAPLAVSSSPRKELRGGRVTIRPGAATVSFRCTWDDVRDLMDTYGLDPDDQELRSQVTSYFEGGIGFDADGDTVGASESASVEAGTFAELIAAIDAVEDLLLEVERENGAHFEAFCRELRGGAPTATREV
jgi:hypothetical protein